MEGHGDRTEKACRKFEKDTRVEQLADDHLSGVATDFNRERLALWQGHLPGGIRH